MPLMAIAYLHISILIEHGFGRTTSFRQKLLYFPDMF